MEAGDPGAGGVAGDAEGQASAGGPGGQGGPGGPQGPGRGGSGEASTCVMGVVQAAPALDAPVEGSDVEPAPLVRFLRPVPLQFVLLVPFRSTMEAEFACHLLAPDARTQPAVAHQEVTVSGTLLTICLTAEDTDQLRLSISSCLQELLLVIRTMRRVLLPFLFANPNRVSRG